MDKSSLEVAIGDLDNTVVTADLYNRDYITAITNDDSCDTECGCIGQSKEKECVYLNLCLDSSLYDWVAEQGKNYHLTISELIATAIKKQQV